MYRKIGWLNKKKPKVKNIQIYLMLPMRCVIENVKERCRWEITTLALNVCHFHSIEILFYNDDEIDDDDDF